MQRSQVTGSVGVKVSPKDSTSGNRPHGQRRRSRAINELAPLRVFEAPVDRDLGEPGPAADTVDIEDGKESCFPVCRLVSRGRVGCPVIVICVLLSLQIPRDLEVFHHASIHVSLELGSPGRDTLNDRVVWRQVCGGARPLFGGHRSPVRSDGKRPLKPRLPAESLATGVRSPE